MKTTSKLLCWTSLALSLCVTACAASDATNSSKSGDLPASIRDRFEAMKGPLGCAPTTSLTPDPPRGCEGAAELVAAASRVYSNLSREADFRGSPPDLAPSLTRYESEFASKHPFVEHRIDRSGFTIAAREFGAEHAGAGPTLVLMHGFPDNQHLYDRIAPRLGETYRTITFDFVGWGHSTLPGSDYAYTVESLRADLEATIAYFGITRVIPVVHDASGWPGIDWALDHESQVAALVLLNTAYHPIAALAPPYVIRALSSPDLRPRFLAALGTDELMNQALFRAQVGEFFTDDSVKAALLPVLQASIPRAGLVGLTEDLRSVVLARSQNVPRMQAFAKPVLVAFGADDPFLNQAVARAFATTFLNAKLELVAGAGHYVQLDQPDAVIDAIVASAAP